MALTRRTYLQGVGALAVASMTGLAGCASGRASPTGDSDGDRVLSTEPAYDGWFDGVETYRGTYDMRGRPAVTVTVGAKDSRGYFAFAPAALAVSPGATVSWEWAGKGGSHDVVALDGSFESALTGRAGATFEHTFDAPGVFKYYCRPHRMMGMKGAVTVLDGPVAGDPRSFYR